MKDLNEHLKTKEFKNVYLLYGEETFLKKTYKKRLAENILDGGNSMNQSYFEGKSISASEIIELAETLPFFAPSRVIVIENSGFFKKTELQLTEYIKDLPETSYIIFVETEVDKRNKMFKTVKDLKTACITEFVKQEERTLIPWVAGILKKDGIQIQANTAKYLLEKVGTDMERLAGELEKLTCYTMGRNEVTIDDVDAICIAHISNHIFDMISAVALKQQKQALDYYYELLALKEAPTRILFLLAKQFRQLANTKQMQIEGVSNKDMASVLGVAPFIVNKLIAQAKHFPQDILRQAIEDAVEYEELVKTGRLTDKLAVELFIVKYTS